MSALVALAAGGTGGHLFPAEALAEELKRRGHRVLLATDARGARYAHNFPCNERFEISAASPNVGGVWSKAAAAVSMAGGLITALSWFKRYEVAAAVGFGGYPSLPSMKAAQILGLPYGVHEQNGVLGRANRMVAAGATFIAHGFPQLDRAPAGSTAKALEVGNPVRDAVQALANTPYDAPSLDGPISLLIFGGSQGASLFSSVAPAMISALPAPLRKRLRVVHQVREAELAEVSTIYEKAGVEALAAPFFQDLPQRIAAAHLVIARAGASTVTELATIGRPSILVPLAIAMDDHQTGNAGALASRGGAVVIAEKEFTSAALGDQVRSLLENPARLQKMAAASGSAVKAGASAGLADLTEDLIRTVGQSSAA